MIYLQRHVIFDPPTFTQDVPAVSPTSGTWCTDVEANLGWTLAVPSIAQLFGLFLNSAIVRALASAAVGSLEFGWLPTVCLSVTFSE